VNFPASGGEYVYLTRAYGPVWGFITGWVSFFAGFSAPIAVASLAFADYLGFFAPGLKQEAAPALFGSGDWTFKFGGAQIARFGTHPALHRIERFRHPASRTNSERSHDNQSRRCRLAFVFWAFSSEQGIGRTSDRRPSERRRHPSRNNSPSACSGYT
jgi:hypothetical protein